MRVLILGGDGYLGWPAAMHFAAKGDQVVVVDNYLRRTIAHETRSEALFPTPNLHDRAALFRELTGHEIEVRIFDCTDYRNMAELFQSFRPETTIHFAEQPSAPYSMMGFDQTRLTLDNNLQSTMNLIWPTLQYAPECHIIKLGTMGEYGTPNIDIEEGYIEIEHKGRKDRFLYPRQAGSLYHTTKVMDTDLLWFYVRLHGLRVTDLMQGPVYGITTPYTELDDRLLTHFNYDDIFGTVVNRFLIQAISGIPLTVYGKGGQTRGYINIIDSINCIDLASGSPPNAGEMRIFNQLSEHLRVTEIAESVRAAGESLGIEVAIKSIANPRKELEEHYYNPIHTGLVELGFDPILMTPAVLARMMEKLLPYRERVATNRVMPRVKWS